MSTYRHYCRFCGCFVSGGSTNDESTQVIDSTDTICYTCWAKDLDYSKKKLEIKRVYSKEDPYGEEIWD